MYFTSLPDHTDPAFDERLHFSRFRRQNIVFDAISFRSFCDRHVGCLSIKRVLGGEERYGVDRRQLVLRPGRFLILNDNQEYSCRIDAAGEVRVQSVFFSTAFVGAVFRDNLYREEALLDDPFNFQKRSLEFFQAIHDTDPGLEAAFQGLVSALNRQGYVQPMVDERLVFILSHLIRRHKTEANDTDRVGALKAATRNEIHRRLCIARDHLHSTFMESLDLEELGQVSHLSTPQLIRQFKAVFHTTPYQYLVRLRLQHAAGLLRNSALPVHEITWRCGFENVSAFCRAFRAAYGAAPLKFRSMC
jgi:AraC family transcriptional regulator